MIAEPYICIFGPNAGEITWHDPANKYLGLRPYAAFEREKLKDLASDGVFIMNGYSLCGFYIFTNKSDRPYYSSELIELKATDLFGMTESSRLLKRAEFLKAVCEKEGVEWLPEEKPVEYRACAHCERPFPCSFSFKGTPTCKDCPEQGECQKGRAEAPEKCEHPKEWYEGGYCNLCGKSGLHRCTPERDYYTKEEIDQLLKKLTPEKPRK